MPREQIKKVAEGRVWTGEMAKELGLVDELGGIDRALEIAVAKAGIENYSLKSYPAKESFLTNLLNLSGGNFIESQIMKSKLGSYYSDFNLLRTIQEREMIQARLPFELNVN